MSPPRSLGVGLLVLLPTGGCVGDRSIAPDEPSDEVAQGSSPLALRFAWDGDVVRFDWDWHGDVDAFNAIVTRDGVRDAQIELAPEVRTTAADARGAKLVELGVQACNKGILTSNCTKWSHVSASR